MAPFGDFSSFQTPSLNAITNYIFIHNIISLPIHFPVLAWVFTVFVSVLYLEPPILRNRIALLLLHTLHPVGRKIVVPQLSPEQLLRIYQFKREHCSGL